MIFSLLKLWIAFHSSFALASAIEIAKTTAHGPLCSPMSINIAQNENAGTMTLIFQPAQVPPNSIYTMNCTYAIDFLFPKNKKLTLVSKTFQGELSLAENERMNFRGQISLDGSHFFNSNRLEKNFSGPLVGNFIVDKTLEISSLCNDTHHLLRISQHLTRSKLNQMQFEFIVTDCPRL